MIIDEKIKNELISFSAIAVITTIILLSVIIIDSIKNKNGRKNILNIKIINIIAIVFSIQTVFFSFYRFYTYFLDDTSQKILGWGSICLIFPIIIWIYLWLTYSFMYPISIIGAIIVNIYLMIVKKKKNFISLNVLIFAVAIILNLFIFYKVINSFAFKFQKRSSAYIEETYGIPCILDRGGYSAVDNAMVNNCKINMTSFLIYERNGKFTDDFLKVRLKNDNIDSFSYIYKIELQDIYKGRIKIKDFWVSLKDSNFVSEYFTKDISSKYKVDKIEKITVYDVLEKIPSQVILIIKYDAKYKGEIDKNYEAILIQNVINNIIKKRKISSYFLEINYFNEENIDNSYSMPSHSLKIDDSIDVNEIAKKFD